MDSHSKNQWISLPLIIAMIANPVLAERLPASAEADRAQAMRDTTRQVQQRAAMGLAPATQAARIVIDQSVAPEQQPGIKAASNGTPVVDIAAPTRGGVSHNRFTDFSVAEDGVILNNSLAPVLTQLGGWADGNRRLAGGEASIILNEVTGSSRSQLLGHIEVAGKAAEFILANENGITCDGCGFINIPRATLVTGRAQMLNGELDGFTLGAGSIAFEGAGLNAANVDRFDIVTRLASLNASLYGQTVNVFTGNDYFSYRDGQIRSAGGTGLEAGAFALDIAALGGMYAHSIRLIGTEQGLGVNSEGLIQSVEALEITADGDIRLKDTVANQALHIASASGDIALTGQVYSDAVTLSAADTLTTEGWLGAASALSLSASDWQQAGTVYAGVDAAGNLTDSVNLTLSVSNSLHNSGTLVIADDLSANLSHFSNDAGQLAVAGALDLTAGTFSNRAGVIQVNGIAAAIAADTLDNAAGTLAYTGAGDLTVNAATLGNADGLIQGAGRVVLVSDALNNQAGVIAAPELSASVGVLDNSGGSLEAASLIITGEQLINDAGQIYLQGPEPTALTLTLENALSNREGSIYTQAGNITLTAAMLDNTAGNLVTEAGALDLGAGALNNAAGSVLADTLTVNADAINNDGGYLQADAIQLTADTYTSAGGVLLALGEAGNSLSLAVSQRLDNTAGALIESRGGQVTLVTDVLNNQGGSIAHRGVGALSLTARELNNNGGGLGATHALLLTTGNLTNRAGQVGAHTLTLTSDLLDNQGGEITAVAAELALDTWLNQGGSLLADQGLAVKVASLNNAAGRVQSAASFRLQLTGSNGLDNRAGIIASGQALDLMVSGVLNNSEGVIHAEDRLSVSARQIDNLDGQLSAATLVLQANQLNHLGDALIDASILQLDVSSLVSSGAIVVTGTADNALSLNVDTYLNRGLLEVYARNLSLAGLDYTTDGGAILHHGLGQLSVATGEHFDNRTGSLVTAGSLTLDARTIDNRGGELVAGTGLNLAVDALDNQGGLVQSGGALSLTLDSLNNSAGGRVIVGGDQAASLNIAGDLNNAGGALIYNGSAGLSVSAHALNNTGGLIGGQGDYAITLTDVLNNTDGEIATRGSLVMAADRVLNLGSAHLEAASVSLTAREFENVGVLLATAEGIDSLQLSVDNLFNRGWVESYGVNLDLTSTRLTQTGGALVHRGAGVLSLAQTSLVNTGDIISSGTVSLVADHLTHQSGLIQAASVDLQLGTLTLDAGSRLLALGHEGGRVSADELANAGELLGVGVLAIDVAGQADNSGAIEAGQLSLAADTLNNLGYIGGDNLTLAARQLTQSDTGVLQTGAASVVVETLENQGLVHAYNAAGAGLTLSADTLVNRGTLESQGARLTLDAGLVDNAGGTLLHSGNDRLQLTAEILDNRAGVISSLLDASVNVDAWDNTDGLWQSAGVATVNLTTLSNQGGVIQSDAGLNLTATWIDNTLNGRLLSAGDITLTAQQLDNSAGQISAAEVSLEADILTNIAGSLVGESVGVTASSVDNTEGVIAATDETGDLSVIVSGLLDNTQGLIQGQGSAFSLHAATLTNAGGDLVQRGDGAMQITAGSLANTQGGNLVSESALSVSVDQTLVNDSGYLQSFGPLTLTAASVKNAGGQLVSGAGVSITANTLSNTASDVSGDPDAVAPIGRISGDWVSLTLTHLLNEAGGVIDGETVLLNADTIDNAGTLAAYSGTGESLIINSQSLHNSGTVQAAGVALSLSQQTLVNSGQIVSGAGLLLLDGETVTNTGTLAAGQVSMDVTDFDNTDGALLGLDEATAALAAETLTNTRGLISAGNLTVTADTLDNIQGELNAATLIAEIAQVDNTGGRLLADNLSLSATTITNAATADAEPVQGYISAATLSLTASIIDNAAVIQGGSVSLQAGQLTNDQGLLLATDSQGESLSLEVETLSNRSGAIESHGESLVIGAPLDNTDGSVVLGSAGHLSLGALDNTRGLVASAGDLSVVHAGALLNTEGRIQAAATLTLDASDIDNTAGVLMAGEQLTLTATTVDNREAGLILAEGTADDSLRLTVTGGLNNQGGRIESYADNLNLSLGGIDNTGGALYHLGSGVLRITSTADLATGQGVIGSSGSLELQAAGALNNEGELLAAGRIDLLAETFSNVLGALIQGDSVAITATDGVNAGVLQTESLSLVGEHFTNRATEVEPGVWAGGELLVTGTGADSLNLALNALNNLSGALVQVSADDLWLNTAVNNHGGTLMALGNSLGFSALDNSGGEVLAAGDLAVNQAVFSNLGGLLRAEGSLDVAADTVDNRGGLWQALDTLQLTAGSLDNSAGGSLVSLQGFSVNLTGELNNREGSLISEAGSMTVSAGELINTLGYLEHRGAGTLDLGNLSQLDNSGGQISTLGQLSLSVDSLLNNALTTDAGAMAAVISAAHLILTADLLENRGGYLQGTDSLSLTLPELDNQGGQILSLGTADNAFTLHTEVFDNTDGGLRVNSQDLRLTDTVFINTGGTLDHRGNGVLQLTGTDTLQNAGGQLLSAGDMQLAFADINNQAGTLAGRTLTIDASNSINNREAGRLVGETLDITAATLDNRGGLLASIGEGDATFGLAVGQINNTGGTLRNSSTDWTVSLEGIDNTGGSIIHTGGGELNLSVADDLTIGGTLATTGNMTLSAQSLASSGNLLADGNLSITSLGDIRNTDAAGVIRAGGALRLDAGGDIVNVGGITALTDLDMIAAGIINNQGVIVTDAGQANLAATALTNSGTLAHNGSGVLRLDAATIQNLSAGTAGTIKSEGTLQLVSSNITNGGVISASVLQVAGFDSITGFTGSRIEAGDIELQGNRLENAGTLVASNAENSLALTLNNLTNTGTLATNSRNQAFTGDVVNSGSIVHAGTGVLKLGEAGSVNIAGGSVATAGRAELRGGISGAGQLTAQNGITIAGMSTFTNNGSYLYTQGNLVIDAALQNHNGTLLAGGTLAIDTTGSVNNNNGTVQGGVLQITAGSINNTGGTLLSRSTNGNSYLNASSVNNTAGTIMVNNQNFSLTTRTGSLNNTGGVITHNNTGDFTINVAGDLDNLNEGSLQTLGFLNLNAGDLNNAAGSTVSAGHYVLALDNLINAGAIDSRGLAANSITATNLTNTGTLSGHGAGLSVTVANTLDNTEGDILFTGVGELLLDVNRLLNATADSKIASADSLNIISDTALTNGGTLSGAYSNSILAPAVTNLATGVIDSEYGAVAILESSAFSNAGAITGGALVSVNTGSFTNTGSIKSDGTVHLQMDSLTLDGEIAAGKLLDLNVGGDVILSAGDVLESAGNLFLRTDGDIINGGIVRANNLLWLAGDNLVNQAGGQIRAGVLNNTYPTNFEVLAPEVSSLDFNGNILNHGVISSAEHLALSAQTITNNKDVLAGKHLWLFANTLQNNTDAVAFSGGNMVLGVTHALNNMGGDILTLGHMVMDDRRFSDQASLGVNLGYSDLFDTGGTVTINGGRIESYGNMQVDMAAINLIRNGITLVEGETRVDEVETPQHSYPGLESTVVDNMNMIVGHRPQYHDMVDSSGASTIVTYESALTRTTETDYNVEVDENSRESILAAGGNMVLENAHITNSYGALNVGGDLRVQNISYAGDTAQNYTDITVDEGKRYAFTLNNCSDPLPNGICGIGEMVEPGETISVETGPTYGSINVVGVIHGAVDGDFVTAIDRYEAGANSAGSTQVNVNMGALDYANAGANTDYTLVIKDARNGQLLGTGARQLEYRGVLNGQNGSMPGGGDTDIGPGLGNGGYRAFDYTLAEGKTQLAAASSVTLAGTGYDAETASVLYEDLLARYNTRPDLVLSEERQIALTGEVFVNPETGELITVDITTADNSTDVTEAEVGSADSQADDGTAALADFTARAAEQGKVVVLTASGQYVMVAPASEAAAGDATPAELNTLPDNFNPGNLGGLYVTNTTPEGDYLIETRPEFTEYSQFLGSDYLLAALGVDPEKTIKRLGDAFYENQIIRDALTGQANTRYLGEATNDFEQMQTLMDNAVKANQSLTLAVGVALSPEQIKDLQQDIVWMVEEEVDGETVLVPRLYLASVTEADLLAPSNAIRSGGGMALQVEGDIELGTHVASRGDVILQAGGNYTQSGNLTSDGNVWLDAGGNLVNDGSVSGDLVELTAAGNINNQGALVGDRGLWLDAGGSIVNHSVGEMVSGGVLSLRAMDDITNRQGYLEGVDVSLTAVNGDIINRTEFEQTTRQTRTGFSTETRVGEASVIVSHNSLLMDAGNNIDLQGSDFTAAGNISLLAGNDVLMGAVENKQASAFDLGHLAGERNHTRYDVVDINAGGHLLVTAGRDIVGAGAQLNAGGSALLDAGRDISLTAVANVDHSAFQRSNYERTDTIVAHTQASVNAAGDASLHAGQDINLIGANVLAGGNASLHAERDTNILSVTDSEHHYRFERDDKSFGRSSTTEVETLSSTNVGSVIQAGGNITINTLLDQDGNVSLQGSRNVTIQGSLLDAGGDIAVSALENVTMTTAQETYLDYRHSSSSGLGGLTGRSQTDTAADVVQVGSMLNSGNDVVVMAGNDVGIAGSVISANNDVELYAGLINDEADINIESVNHESYRASESSRTSVSLDISSDSVSVSEEKTVNQDNTNTANAASYILAGGEIYGDAARDINVTGSVVNANGAVQLDAGRNVTIQSGVSGSSAGDEDKKRSYGASWDTTSNDVSAFVGSETNATRHQQDGQGVVGSYIAGEQINVNSGEDINVVGSDLNAGGSIILDAENDVNILSSEEALTTSTRTSFTQDGLTMTFSHNVGQAVDAIGDLGSGGDAASDASGVMKAMDAMDSVAPSASIFLGKTTTSQTESDTSTFARGSNLNAGDDVVIIAGNNATVSGSQVSADRNIQVDANDITVSSAENTTQLNSIHNYDQVGLTLAGGQGNVSLTAGFATSESDYQQQMVTTTGSSLSAGQDVNLNARNDLTIEGSDINAERNVNLHADNNVAIIAGEGYVRSTLDEEHLSGGGGVNLGSDGFGYTAYVAAGENDLDRQNITNHNSTVSVGEGLNITSGADADISGANLTAADVNMDIGGDLTVSSVQDTGSVSGRRWDASLSVTVGAGVSANVSVGYGETEGSSAWVSDQTSITGSNSVNINVGGHTQVDGALIANIQENGTDGGNLNLSTDTFGYSNLEDHHEETSTYLSVGVGMSGGGGNATQNDSWSVSGNYSDVDQQQTTYATLGNGAITVRSDSETVADSTAGINRDIDGGQAITRDKEVDVEVYVTSNSIESFSGLFTADNPDTPEIENTFLRWQDNIENFGRNTVLLYEGINDFTEDERVPEWARTVSGAMVDMSDAASLFGIAPGVKNHGGLAGQAGALLVGDQFFYHVEAETSYDPETMGVVVDNYEIRGEVDAPWNGSTVSTNGINNTLDDSIRNGVMQAGNNEFIDAYDPQHGFLGDLVESFWDSNLGGVVPTGNARQLGNFYQTGIDNGASFNIAAHSAGTLKNYRAIDGLDFTGGGVIQPGSVQFSGSPVGADTFFEVTTSAGFSAYVENKNGELVPNLIFQTNRPEGETSLFGFPLVDSVSDMPVFLGGNYNQGEGSSLGGSFFSLPYMFLDGSPHSNYVCQTPACRDNPESMPTSLQTFQDNPRTPETDGRGYIRPEVINPPAPELNGSINNQYQLSSAPLMTSELSGEGLSPAAPLVSDQQPLIRPQYQYPEHNVEPQDRPNSQQIDLTFHPVPEGDGQTGDQENGRRQIILPEEGDETTEKYWESIDD